jgi:hypothetical protein
MNSAALLFEWTGLNDASVAVELGYNQHGTRGLLASDTLNPNDTVLVLPWKFVLGTSAAFRLLQVEQGKGRTVFSHPVEFIPDELSKCDIKDETQVWSCIMACALLAAARYPLSSWGPFISCLPSSPGRIDGALRSCHAYAVMQSIKSKARDKLPNRRGKLSQQVLRDATSSFNNVLRMDRDSICDVLLWSRDEIAMLCDDELEGLIERDWAWIRRAWEALFVDPPRHSDDDEKTEPLVSWPSWLWAHAIVKSRAIAMPLAPRNILAFPPTHLIGDINDDSENNLSSMIQHVFGEGVLLPIIDLINHGGCTGANATLELRPEGVAVVAKATISAGEEVLFDYHPNATLQSLLRGYGFVDCFSAPVRQVFRVEFSRVEIDVNSTCGLSSGIDSSGAEDVGHSLPGMRVVDVIPSPGGGIRFVIRDNGHGLDGIGVCCRADRFADEGSLCGAVAACCSIVLDGMEHGRPYNDTATAKNGEGKCIALAYRAANVSLLHRCINDLSTLASLLE